MASSSVPTSSDDPGRLRSVLEGYARLLAVGGMLVLTLALVLDPRWTGHPTTIALMFAATVALRSGPIRLSKYSYLTQTGLPALVGLAIAPPAAALLSVGGGVFACDVLWLRKPVRAGVVNAGREVLALAAAAGLYLLGLWLTGVREPTVDFLPAAAVLAGGYFFSSRLLFYFTLLVRAKLDLAERLFILRWEIVTYLLTLLGAGLAVWALATLTPVGWLAMLFTVSVGGLLLRTLIEEAIAAEDLNKIHYLAANLASAVSQAEAFGLIEQLAHRLLDWGDFRIYRRGADGAATLLYRGTVGRPARGAPDPALEPLRARVLREGEPAIVNDLRREGGLQVIEPEAVSLVVYPLASGDDVLGTFELEHRKERYYRARDQAAIGAIASQIVGAIHIAELRRPLLQTVDQIQAQIHALARTADTLRVSARALANASEGLRQRTGMQEEVARRGLETTASLASIAAETAEGGAAPRP